MHYKLEIFTDNHGEDISWDFKDYRTGDIVLVSNDTYPANEEIIEEGCIESNCYVFTIRDSYGDGLCCDNASGYYKLFINNYMVGEGSKFEKEEIILFGKCRQIDAPVPTSSPPIRITSAPSKIDAPVPTSSPSIRITNAPTKIDAPVPTPSPSIRITNAPSKIDAPVPTSSPSIRITNAPSKAFCEMAYRLELFTDNYGYETYWDIKHNITGNIAAHASIIEVYPDNSLIIEEGCIQPDCYEFRISDVANDGLIGDGNYKFFINGEFVGEGSDFGRSDSIFFGECTSGNDELKVEFDE